MGVCTSVPSRSNRKAERTGGLGRRRENIADYRRGIGNGSRRGVRFRLNEEKSLEPTSPPAPSGWPAPARGGRGERQRGAGPRANEGSYQRDVRFSVLDNKQIVDRFTSLTP